MYKGLIEAIGVVEKIVERHGSKDFTIRAPEVLVDCQLGDSLGINGVCLTVTEFNDQTFKATAVPETLAKTNLNELQEGDFVNMERSMQASARIGGHLVQGHVDTKIKILDIQVDGDAWNVYFSLPAELAPYVVNKGFVGLDGMSITVVERFADRFSVTLIPYTREATIAKNYRLGSLVNLEVDMMAKYVENLVKSILDARS